MTRKTRRIAEQDPTMGTSLQETIENRTKGNGCPEQPIEGWRSGLQQIEKAEIKERKRLSRIVDCGG
jgi:hypothetical protein